MAGGPNLCLVVVDAYRQDHMGLFDGSCDLTPRLDARCGSWTRFDDAFASAPWTLPACTTILTGVEASRHGRFAQAGPPLTVPTIAEMLPDEYECAAFVNNGNLAPSSGLHRGFGTHRVFQDHAMTFDAAREFLASRKGDTPYFLLLHTNIPHDFYLDKARPYYEAAFGTEGWHTLGTRVLSWDHTTAEERVAAVRSYGASVAHLDAEVDRFLDMVDLDTTAVVLTADHGEGLDRDGDRVHHGGRVHDDLIRVPMLVHVPETTSGPRLPAPVSEETAGQVDIAPTLLGLAGVRNHAATDGLDLLASRSPALQRIITCEDRRYLYVRGRHRMNMNRTGKNMSRAQRVRNGIARATVLREFSIRALVQNRHKVIVTTLVPGSAPVRVARPVLERMTGADSAFVHVGRALVGVQMFDLHADGGEREDILPGLGALGAEERMPGLAGEVLRAGGGETGLLDALAKAAG